MAAPSSDLTAALATLRSRWGAAAPGFAGTFAGTFAGEVVGALATVPLEAPDVGPAPAPVADPDRVHSTGFAELDAILGPGGVPRGMGLAVRGDVSSGRTTLALRLVAEAQAAGSIVAWLDLAAALDPVEAVARGVKPEWLVVLTPARSRGGPRHRRLAARGPGGGPARHRPARPGGWRRELECPGLGRSGSEIRRSTGTGRGARPPGRHHPRGARAADNPRFDSEPSRRGAASGARARGVDRRGDRDPARARASIVDPARARRRRPANGGGRRAQSRRPTRAAGDVADPLRRRRRARRLPPPPRAPRRARHPPRPRSPSARDTEP